MTRAGLEPATYGLKVRVTTRTITEPRAHPPAHAGYCVPIPSPCAALGGAAHVHFLVTEMATPPCWWLTKDGDTACLALYERHYSSTRKRGQLRQFVGPGEKVVLRTERGDAFFVWRKFIDDSGQEGVNCAAFRNESEHRSSDLIRQADAIADCLWPGERHYTFVDPRRVRSSNPGYCFLRAGWRRCGRTKGGLVILARAHLTPHAPERGAAAEVTDHD